MALVDGRDHQVSELGLSIFIFQVSEWFGQQGILRVLGLKVSWRADSV